MVTIYKEEPEIEIPSGLADKINRQLKGLQRAVEEYATESGIVIGTAVFSFVRELCDEHKLDFLAHSKEVESAVEKFIGNGMKFDYRGDEGGVKDFTEFDPLNIQELSEDILSKIFGVKIEETPECETCHGYGKIYNGADTRNQSVPCDVCNGSGKLIPQIA